MADRTGAYLAYELRHPSKPTDTVPAGLSFGKSTVAQMSFPPFGNRSIAYRLTLPFSFNGLNIDGYFDIVVVQQGRVAITLQFFGISSPFDSAMEQRLMTLTLNRVANSHASG